MVDRIISGGQTGADQGGLHAAKDLGIPTGGTVPHGWKTDAGRNYGLKLRYGLKESKSSEYPVRTRDNVRDSDGTVIVGNWNSPGSKLTYRLCVELGKHVIVNPTPEELRQWIDKHQIKVLNVAGNRERKNPGTHERTRDLIKKALTQSK